MTGDVLLEVYDDLKDCDSVKQGLEALGRLALAFSSPWGFAYHVGRSLVVNGREIYHEISSAITAWDNAEYYEFGEDIGLALATAILNSEKPIEDEMTAFVQ